MIYSVVNYLGNGKVNTTGSHDSYETKKSSSICNNYNISAKKQKEKTNNNSNNLTAKCSRCVSCLFFPMLVNIGTTDFVVDIIPERWTHGGV
jgi:hypothetical protein